MRSRRTSSEHQEAVARRLSLLSAELEASRAGLEASRAEPAAPAAGGEWWSEHTRVSATPPGLRVVPTPAPELVSTAEARAPALAPAAVRTPDDLPPTVPVPGRHAAPRRTVRWLDVAVPDTLRGRVGLGPGPLTVVALVVAIGMTVTAWFVVRGDPEAPTIAATAPTAGGDLVALPSAGPAQSASSSAGPTGRPGPVTVDVAGKVRRPGIAVLETGARVVDALEAAGGARVGVDLSSLNLARLLVDGEQVLVGEAPPVAALPPGKEAGSEVAGGELAAGPLVNLNVATAAEQLEALPEVGPVTAGAIIAWRDTHGGFSAIEELLEVDGIGEVTLGQIAPHVTV